MTLDLGACDFAGPALPEPFVRFELAGHLTRLGLLKTATRSLERSWHTLREQLRLLGNAGGPQRVHNHVIAPLASCLGYGAPRRQPEIVTREGAEDGGWSMRSADGCSLRSWAFGVDTDLDTPSRGGRAYRFSPMRAAGRVLLAAGERAGLLTNGTELRLLLCDAARPDSHVAIPLTGTFGWRAQRLASDSFRLLLALAAPGGLTALPELLDAARLSQTRVTKELRVQACAAIEGFLQAVLDHPANADELRRADDSARLAARLWEEGLILVYRLLFIFKLESAADPARGFGFAATTLWRTALSPNRALGPLVRRHLDQGHDTGLMLENGLRGVFRLFRDGLTCSELSIAPLGGALFGVRAMPLLNSLAWGERAVALLLDRLLWTQPRSGGRERVQYGALDVEELGRVYEALLELEPGIAVAPMVRLRRAKLEVVVPRHHATHGDQGNVARIEEIPAGRFFLRAGLGRKTTGSYYTPHEFVRFLLRETLTPLLRRHSPDDDPQPGAILSLRVLDPTAGSGHFLVEACRFLGDALYAACRLCDERAAEAEAQGNLARAAALRRRVADLPDPDGALLAYLPSRVVEGTSSGVSQSRALALCRRLVAVHCLYGIDRNPLAVELAKLSLWLESYAEGLPLTFLDHRLVQGDSLTGPVRVDFGALPVTGMPLDPLLAHGVGNRLHAALHAALTEVTALEASIGWNAADLMVKQQAKRRLDAALSPLRLLAQAWSGAVMLGWREADDEWQMLASRVVASGVWPETLSARQAALCEAGASAITWELTFPEVFQLSGGFDVVLSNPPWDMLQPKAKEFLAGLDLSILDAPTRREAEAMQRRLLADPAVAEAFRRYREGFACQHRAVQRFYSYQTVSVNGELTGGKLDSFRVFAERCVRLSGRAGAIGLVVPSAFHANEGATGIRRLYLRETRLDWCLSFENRHRLFDIDSRFKFALIVARRPGPTQSIRCGFYLTDFAEIEHPGRLLDYDCNFIAATGGPHLTFLELRDSAHLAVVERLFADHQNFAAWTARLGVQLSREVHMTDDAASFIPAMQADSDCLLLHEGKTIHAFADRWETPPRYAIATKHVGHRPQWLENVRYFRATFRDIAGATDERSVIAAMLPPGVLCGHTLSVERTPARRPNAAALILVAVMNSFPFDWMLRQKSATHVSLYLLAGLAVPPLNESEQQFLAHGALRLVCNHEAYAPLWCEQLGTRPPPHWPAVADEEARWQLRAAMDAVVARSYGLTRADYAAILAGFSHRSAPASPALCLAAFDELAAIGLDAFRGTYDPYVDVPLISSNPSSLSACSRAGSRCAGSPKPPPPGRVRTR